MATFTWRPTNGSAFDTAANWDMGSAPGANDTAVLSTGGGLGGTGFVDTLNFNTGGWYVAADLTATTVLLSNTSITLSGSASKLVVNGSLIAGQSGSATLGLTNAARLVATASAGSGLASSFGSANFTLDGGAIASFGAGLNFGTVGGATNASVSAAVLAVGGLFRLGTAAGGTGALNVQNGSNVVLSAPGDSTANAGYLQLGAAAGSKGYVGVTGGNTSLIVASNGATVGVDGTGTLAITGGATVRTSTANNPLSRSFSIGFDAGSTGTVTVSGSGSTLAANGTVSVGVRGTGSLTVSGGATVTSATVATTEAALSVAAAGGGKGALTIDGAGSQLAVSGQAVIGGDDRGTGLSGGGTGTVTLSNGGVLQTGSMTILGGSSLSVDGASADYISGNLSVSGTLTTAGTLVVSGTVSGTGLRVAGGTADVGLLASASASFTSNAGTLLLRNISGSNTITGLEYGDRIDLVGNTSVRLTGTLVTTSSGATPGGTIQLGAAPADTQYTLASDGNGGTIIGLTAGTIGVYRFFDSTYGTHFFSSSVSEKDTIIGTRPDLVFEGVGLDAIDPAGNDPNAAPVYRFFDSNYGTHFFTASAAERDAVIATRADLLYEGTGFVEHTTAQPGDTPVYRFFDTRYGTHFYTADANERATVLATRPDLTDEGIGFYAPAQT